MAPYQNCLLGALVLYKYVENPYTAQAKFNFKLFQEDIIEAVLFLNWASKLNQDRHPLQEQRDMDVYSRRIGLELTGIADTLAMLNLPYKACPELEEIMQVKAIIELYASSKAVEYVGVAPALSDNNSFKSFMLSSYIKSLFNNVPEDKLILSSRDIVTKVSTDRLANTAFNTLGPCGTISIVAENCSSGIEPVFSLGKYIRKTHIGGPYELLHGPVLKHCYETYANFNEIISKYQDAHTVSTQDRLGVQALLQRYTDSSVSSTINLPKTALIDTVKTVYKEAFYQGLKGITIFRDGCKDGVLTKVTTAPTTLSPFAYTTPIKKELLYEEDAKRYKIRWKNSNLYCIVVYDETETPIEVFAKPPRKSGMNQKGEFESERYFDKMADWDGLCRQISLNLRYNVPLEEVVEQLDDASYSLVDSPGILARILKMYLPDTQQEETDETDCSFGGGLCPECRNYAVIREAGCEHCTICDYSKC